MVATRRHGVLQGGMRPFLVVFRTEPSEPALLRSGMRCGRPGGFGFEHGMELLVRAILLRVAEGNPFGDNPEAHPPDRQPRQARDARARKGPAVITANALRQPILGERALEAPPGG